MGSKDDFSSDLSEDEDEDGDGSDNSEKPRVSVFAAEGEFHSEFSVSADEEELSDQGQKKIGTREVKSKSIFDDSEGSSDGGGLFDRRPPALTTPSKGEEVSASGEEQSESDNGGDSPEMDDKDGRKEIIKPKPVKPVMLGFAAELAKKIGAPPPSSRPGGPPAELDPEATNDPDGDGVKDHRSKSSPPETKSAGHEVAKVQKSRSAGNARERSNRPTKESLLQDSSSEDELFRPSKAARLPEGMATTSRARHTLFDSSDSDSGGGLFSGGSTSLFSSTAPGSNTQPVKNLRQDRQSSSKSNLEYRPAANKIPPKNVSDVGKPTGKVGKGIV